MSYAVWLWAVVLARAASAQAVPLDVTLSARAFQPGELVVVTMTLEHEPTAVRVAVFGREALAFRAADRRWQALVGIDVAQAPGRYTLEVEASVDARSPPRVSVPLVVVPKRFATRRLTVDPAFVEPSAEALDRIASEQTLLAKAYGASASRRRWERPFTPPVAGATGSRFGARSMFNGQPRAPHAGTDLRAALGTPVVAPNAGRVVLARDLFFTGNTVIIDHGLGLSSLLAHLSTIAVPEGEILERGRLVGLAGATGRVTGPHLHWAMRVSGARVDPMSLLALLGDAASPPDRETLRAR